jgi:hypothetical protein
VTFTEAVFGNNRTIISAKSTQWRSYASKGGAEYDNSGTTLQRGGRTPIQTLTVKSFVFSGFPGD